jgi:AIR synthase-related protein
MTALDALAAELARAPGLAAKADIAAVTRRRGLTGAGGAAVPVGDDCAAIPDGDGHLLFAIEGFMNRFVAADPWFAGWCGVMVNLSDIAAMGGRPIAVVDALWSPGDGTAAEILDGLRAAARCYDVPVVGGHSNLSTPQPQLAVAVLGRAERLLTSADARPGDRLVMAVDLRGAWRPPFDNWQAALGAPADRLRGDLALLPAIAEAGLARAAKDISQAGVVGTAAMLAECSGVGITIDVTAIPAPPDTDPARWLKAFPSFGYLLAVAPEHEAAVIRRFTDRDIAAATIGHIHAGSVVAITDGRSTAAVCDPGTFPLLGCAPHSKPADTRPVPTPMGEAVP